MAIVQVPITKSKGGYLEINTDDLPEDTFREVVLQGLKVVANRGASKVTSANIPNEEERKAEALAIAQKQYELMLTSKIRFTGGKAKKASGAVMTEARRQAKLLVKQAMKDAGMKVSHVEPKLITQAANELLASDQGKDIIAEAEKIVSERAKTPIAIDIKSLIHESPELVAKAAARKASKPLSAKQAGIVTHRAKPEVRVNH